MSAKISSVLVTLWVAGFCAGLYAQDRGDVFTVGFSNEVVVGDKILPVGSWDIRWEDSRANPTLKFYRGNVVNAEIAAVSITSEDNKKSSATEAVLEKIGPDYYLTNIWIKGDRTGYALRLRRPTGSLQHGDVQRIPATLVSGSWFAQGAWIEGQSRTHVGQGLGNPDDRHQTGVVVARTFTPAVSESDGLAQIRPSATSTLSDDPGSRPIALSEERSGSAPVLSGAVAQSESPFVPENSSQGSANGGSSGSPAPQSQGENALNQPGAAGSSSADAGDSPAPDSPTEVAALTPFEQPEAIQSATPEEQELAGLPEALPATASYWPAFVLIGCGLIGLSFLVRRI